MLTIRLHNAKKDYAAIVLPDGREVRVYIIDNRNISIGAPRDIKIRRVSEVDPTHPQDTKAKCSS